MKLIELCRSWWKETNIETKLPHARHRPVECFFAATAVFFEPRFALVRSVFAKCYELFTVVDDCYDAFGIYDEELKFFTKALERFDIRAKDEIPVQYLKTIYEVLINYLAEIKDEMIKQGRAHCVSYVVEEAKKMVRAFDFEARCKDGGIVPTFDEFMKNAMLTSAVPLFLALSMIGVEEADENTYQWVTNYNDSIIVKGFCIVSRMYDDLGTNEVEEKRGLVTAQACYMKQFGVSKEEAIEGFKEIAEVGWKDVNEGFMRPTPVVREIVDIILNGCRLADVFYKNGEDLFVNSEKLIPDVTKVFIDPIPLQQ